MAENPYSAPQSEAGEGAAVGGRSRLVPVAVALLVVSIVWIFLTLFGIVYFLWAASVPDRDAEIQSQFSAYAVYLAISLAYSLVLVTGAFSMLRRGSYAWAVTVNCLALVPFMGPCYVLAIPVGVWGLFVLRQPTVKASFQKL